LRYILIFIALFSTQSHSGALDEDRCCITPIRLADGSIKRRVDVLVAFKKHHPCPSTGLTKGACPGWAINHSIPLVCGGRDIVSNLAWMPNVLKSGKGSLPVDRWERKVYCKPQILVPMHLTGELTIK
jgi:hypothetical protein